MFVEHVQLNIAVLCGTEHFYRNIHKSEADSPAPNGPHNAVGFCGTSDKKHTTGYSIAGLPVEPHCLPQTVLIYTEGTANGYWLKRGTPGSETTLKK
jgi:hypothetical protein